MTLHKGSQQHRKTKNRKRNGLKGSLFLMGALSHEDCVDMGYLHGRGVKHTLSPRERGVFVKHALRASTKLKGESA
jgi:hypothetical protein